MIKNIIFDVGNVLVKWDPINIIQQAFPNKLDLKQYLAIFITVMTELDVGALDFPAAKYKLQQQLQVKQESIENLFAILFASLIALPEGVNLLTTLAQEAKFSLYCLTNMSEECFLYLSQKFNFWHNFKGVVVSAKVKLSKPDPKIYQYILTKFNLLPNETVFIDDVLENVIAAQNLGIYGIQCTDFIAVRNELVKLQIIK